MLVDTDGAPASTGEAMGDCSWRWATAAPDGVQALMPAAPAGVGGCWAAAYAQGGAAAATTGVKKRPKWAEPAAVDVSVNELAALRLKRQRLAFDDDDEQGGMVEDDRPVEGSIWDTIGAVYAEQCAVRSSLLAEFTQPSRSRVQSFETLGVLSGGDSPCWHGDNPPRCPLPFPAELPAKLRGRGQQMTCRQWLRRRGHAHHAGGLHPVRRRRSGRPARRRAADGRLRRRRRLRESATALSLSAFRCISTAGCQFFSLPPSAVRRRSSARAVFSEK